MPDREGFAGMMDLERESREALVLAQVEIRRLRHALELVAHHEWQEDERAEAMRQIARHALGLPT